MCKKTVGKSVVAIVALFAGLASAGEPRSREALERAMTTALEAAASNEQAANAFIAKHRAEAAARGYGVAEWEAEWRTTFAQKRIRASVEPDVLAAGSLAQVELAMTKAVGVGSLTADPALASKDREKFLGDSNIELVYTPMTPCRLVDTRTAGQTALVNGNTRSYLVTGGSYGGAAGCAVTGTFSGSEPAAVAVNLTVIGSTFGNVEIRPYLAANLTSTVNIIANQAVANSTVVGTCRGCGPDIQVEAQIGAGGNAHVLVDLLGFFTEPFATAVDCLNVIKPTTSTIAAFSGGVPGYGFNFFTSACAAGYSVTGGSCQIQGASSSTRAHMLSSTGQFGVNSWYCNAGNWDSSSTYTLQTSATCCRVPGK